jgi:hypothetical protein
MLVAQRVSGSKDIGTGFNRVSRLQASWLALSGNRDHAIYNRAQSIPVATIRQLIPVQAIRKKVFDLRTPFEYLEGADSRARNIFCRQLFDLALRA